MLYSKGTAWLNGSQVPRSSAIFPGDIVQTEAESLANINAVGSNVMILSDSLVKFEGGQISVEHGRVSVVTSKGMGTRAGDVVVTPLSAGVTEFEVVDLNGTVEVMARKGDVSVDNGWETTTLPKSLTPYAPLAVPPSVPRSFIVPSYKNPCRYPVVVSATPAIRPVLLMSLP